MTRRRREFELSDLTQTQRRTLARISRTNINARRGDDWVSTSEGLHKGSLAALERLGIVEYDRYLGRAKTRPAHFWIVSLCRQAIEHGTCATCSDPLGGPDARGWMGDGAYHYECARAVFGDEFRQTVTLTTVEVSGAGQSYKLLEVSKVGLSVHLAGPGKTGGTGPCICGFDRHASTEDGRHLHGFSVGGGVTGPGYDHQVCVDCARLAGDAPLHGIHANLFRLEGARQ
jgi:hypothetical protein